MQFFEENYNGNVIRVENAWKGESLFVNGILQDEQLGLCNRSRLFGQLSTGEKIKVSLGGNFKVGCRIFVDNKLLTKTKGGNLID